MLRVIQPFGDHKVGDEITDSAAIETIKGSDHMRYVVTCSDPELAPPGSTSLAEPQE